ncbi:hypothetical protein V3C99_004227 [Haemonchus contortus]
MEVVEDSMDMSPTFSTPQMRMKPMWMWFHTTVNDVILFESWTVTTPRAMVWSCFVVITMGVLLEFVRYTRWRFEVNFKNDVQLNTNYMTRLFSLPHVVQTVLFGVQMVLAYFLMLIFMTFSVWLGIAVCVGAGLGFLLFGSRQRKRSFVESLDQNTGRCCMMMKMYFHFRIQEPILFREWMALNMTGFVFSCIGVAVIAGLYEVVKLGRLSVERTVNEQHLCGCDGDAASLHRIAVEPGMPCGVACENRKTESPFLSSNLKRPMHTLSSAIFFLQMFIAYSLMMISMTYNVPIFISLVLGHTLTYFLLGPLVSVQEYEKLGDCCA